MEALCQLSYQRCLNMLALVTHKPAHFSKTGHPLVKGSCGRTAVYVHTTAEPGIRAKVIVYNQEKFQIFVFRQSNIKEFGWYHLVRFLSMQRSWERVRYLLPVSRYNAVSAWLDEILNVLFHLTPLKLLANRKHRCSIRSAPLSSAMRARGCASFYTNRATRNLYFLVSSQQPFLICFGIRYSAVTRLLCSYFYRWYFRLGGEVSYYVLI